MVNGTLAQSARAAHDWGLANWLGGSGRYEDALSGAQDGIACPHDAFWALSELIEAATRIGKMQPARDALRQLSEMTRAGDRRLDAARAAPSSRR